jgi:hypothetical protein
MRLPTASFRQPTDRTMTLPLRPLARWAQFQPFRLAFAVLGHALSRPSFAFI